MLMSRIAAFLKLTRIEHSLMLIVAVLAAELIAGSGKLPAAFILLMSLVTPALVSMGSFAINDYYDIETDRANKRVDRPIIAGVIKPGEAFWTAISCFVIGVLASALINSAAFVIALVFAVLAYAYSYRLKNTLLLGNAYIAFSMAIPFVYGSYVVSGSMLPSLLVVFALIFLSGLAREIHGIIRDYAGDRKARHSKSLPYYIGKRWSAVVAFALYVAAIALSVELYAQFRPFLGNIVYLVPILVTDAMLLYVGITYLGAGTKKRYRIARNVSLGAMGLALVAILLSGLFYAPV